MMKFSFIFFLLISLFCLGCGVPKSDPTLTGTGQDLTDEGDHRDYDLDIKKYEPNHPDVFERGKESGGGHKCKSLFWGALGKAIEIISEYNIELPPPVTLEKLKNIHNPEKAPVVLIEIHKGRVSDCPLASGGLICSHSQENIIQLDCGNDGWHTRFDAFQMMKDALHESFYWFDEINDHNYFYSNEIINKMRNHQVVIIIELDGVHELSHEIDFGFDEFDNWLIVE